MPDSLDDPTVNQLLQHRGGDPKSFCSVRRSFLDLALWFRIAKWVDYGVCFRPEFKQSSCSRVRFLHRDTRIHPHKASLSAIIRARRHTAVPLDVLWKTAG